MAERRRHRERPQAKAGRRKAGIVTGAIAFGIGTAVAAGVAAERTFVRRDRGRFDPFRDEKYGTVRGRAIGPVASFDGTLLHVEEAGAGPVTIVLSHGFSLSLLQWHHQIQDLAAGARLVLYDHRGHGRSGRPPSDDWSLEALARDLDAVIRDAAGDERVVLLGHSMGGMTVLKYCELFPEAIGTRVAGLILADTTSADVMGGMLPGVARRVEAAFQALQAMTMRALAGQADRVDRLRARAGDLSYLSTRLMGFGPKPSPSHVAFIEWMLSETPSEVWLNLVPTLIGLDVHDALPAIDVPTLVAVGDRDRLTPLHAAERIAGAIPSAELVVFEETGHVPMIEHPDEFNDHVRRFLARVEQAAAAR